tara:strand:- start:926 stop:3157 length:2232 start_codon:yes stop_codon:yes gene_type:complete
MDKEKLTKILSEDHAPDIDINARKRAVNLAMAEFKTAQSAENKKTSQGFSIFSRLIGINTRKGERIMEQKKKSKFIYGATATAMAVVLVGGLSLIQMNETIDRYEQQAGQGASAQKLNAVQFNVDDEEVAPAYVEAVEQRNEVDLDRAIAEGSSAIPVPIATPDTRLTDSKNDMASPKPSEPLRQWSREADKGASAPMDQLGKKRLMENEAQPVAPVAKEKAERKATVGGQAASVMPQHMVADSMIAPYPHPVPPIYQDQNRDQFEKVTANAFKQVVSDPVSTFSSDVDTASYSFVRKSINNGRLPSPAQVRVEEMVNYFDYNYPVPESRSEPFKPTVTVVDSPWAKGRKLMHIGIKGYQVDKQSLRSNLVFLLDVSGSMNQSDKLPLVKSSMKMLLDSLHPDDTVSIVTYAGHTGVVLEPTKASQRSTIINAMNNLNAGGGTAGAAGIRLAYDMAEQNFDDGAVNRVILATDGDFNVGITNRDDLKRYIEEKREKGIFLSVFGFGMGNYNDQLMQTLAQNGNGIAAYIDSLKEAQKVLVQEATSSLFPIAKDVKFQVEFNPAAVSEYRLIGYETRALKREDFNNDKIDAGDIGAGHTVTAIYEFVPVGSEAVTMDALRYGDQAIKAKPTADANEYAFVKIRYKLPMENTSKLITVPVSTNKQGSLKKIACGPTASCPVATKDDTRFATAVAAFAQKLQGGQYTGDYSYDDIINLAQSARGNDPYGYRAEFIQMVRMAKTLSR